MYRSRNLGAVKVRVTTDHKSAQRQDDGNVPSLRYLSCGAMSGSGSKPSEDLQEWVEKTAISTGATLTVDIRRLGIRRDIQLRHGISLALKKVTGKVTALAQRRGQPRSKSCATCVVGEGPFTECIVLPGQLTKKCANCY